MSRGYHNTDYTVELRRAIGESKARRRELELDAEAHQIAEMRDRGYKERARKEEGNEWGQRYRVEASRIDMKEYMSSPADRKALIHRMAIRNVEREQMASIRENQHDFLVEQWKKDQQLYRWTEFAQSRLDKERSALAVRQEDKNTARRAADEARAAARRADEQERRYNVKKGLFPERVQRKIADGELRKQIASTPRGASTTRDSHRTHLSSGTPRSSARITSSRASKKKSVLAEDLQIEDIVKDQEPTVTVTRLLIVGSLTVGSEIGFVAHRSDEGTKADITWLKLPAESINSLSHAVPFLKDSERICLDCFHEGMYIVLKYIPIPEFGPCGEVYQAVSSSPVMPRKDSTIMQVTISGSPCIGNHLHAVVPRVPAKDIAVCRWYRGFNVLIAKNSLVYELTEDDLHQIISFQAFVPDKDGREILCEGCTAPVCARPLGIKAARIVGSPVVASVLEVEVYDEDDAKIPIPVSYSVTWEKLTEKGEAFTVHDEVVFLPRVSELGCYLRVTVQASPEHAGIQAMTTTPVAPHKPSVRHIILWGKKLLGESIEVQAMVEFCGGPGNAGTPSITWYSCKDSDTPRAECQEIVGARNQLSYVITRAEMGCWIRVYYTAISKNSLEGETQSVQEFIEIRAPAISDGDIVSCYVGQRATVKIKSTGLGTFEYKWALSSDGKTFVRLAEIGCDQDYYIPTADDVRCTLRCQVTPVAPLDDVKGETMTFYAVIHITHAHRQQVQQLLIDSAAVFDIVLASGVPAKLKMSPKKVKIKVSEEERPFHNSEWGVNYHIVAKYTTLGGMLSLQQDVPFSFTSESTRDLVILTFRAYAAMQSEEICTELLGDWVRLAFRSGALTSKNPRKKKQAKLVVISALTSRARIKGVSAVSFKDMAVYAQRGAVTFLNRRTLMEVIGELNEEELPTVRTIRNPPIVREEVEVANYDKSSLNSARSK